MKLIEVIRALVEHFEGMRKLMLCLILSVGAVPLLCLGYISGSEWKEVAVAAIVSYAGANVAEKAVSVASDYVSTRQSGPGAAE